MHPWAAAFLLVVACGTAGVPGAAWPVSWAGLLDALVGGGPPASRPRREPSARRVDSLSGQALPPPTGAAARPSVVLHTCGACVAYGCPSTRQHCDRLAPPLSNFARNSPVITSNIEFVPLELQRFRVVSKNDRQKLRAKFAWAGCCCCLWILRPGPPPPTGAPSWPSRPCSALDTGGGGGLRHLEHADGVSWLL